MRSVYPVPLPRLRRCGLALPGAQTLELALELAHGAPALAGDGASLALDVLRPADGLPCRLEPAGRLGMGGIRVLELRPRLAEHALRLREELAPLTLGGLLALGR